MRPGVLDSLVKGYWRSPERFERHNSGYVGGVHEALSGKQGKPADRRHSLGPIEQRQSLFSLKNKRLDARGRKSCAAGHALARERRFTFADRDQGQMGKGSQIAGSAHRAAGRNHRVNSAVQHSNKGFDNDLATARLPSSQHVSALKHHCANGRFGKRISHSTGMRTNEVQLELAKLSWRYRHIRQSSKPSVDSID